MRKLVAILFVCIFAFVQACPPIYGNCYAFPPDDDINRPIDTDPVDYMSDCIIDRISSWDIPTGGDSAVLRIDSGTDITDGYGIPVTYTNGRAPLVPMAYGTDGENYQDESEWYDVNGNYKNGATTPYGAAYMPFPQNCAIEGWDGVARIDNPSEGDRHICVFDQENCMLYEAWYCVRKNSGFQCTNTAMFNMTQKVAGQRPAGWTSGDAAGLPIAPLLVTAQELKNGEINHAIRFTAELAQYAYTWPGNHVGPDTHTDPTYPVYGSRFRLKAGFDITSYSADTQVFLKALKKYGLIFSDQGTTGYIQAVADPDLDNLMTEINQTPSKKIKFNKANFELVQSPHPIVNGDGYNPTRTCNAVSQNTNPSWQPTWNPNCPAPGSGPVAPTNTPPITPISPPTDVVPSDPPTPTSTPQPPPTNTPPTNTPPTNTPTSNNNPNSPTDGTTGASTSLTILSLILLLPIAILFI